MTNDPAAEQAERLLDERAAARAARDFARADALRDEIAALGFEIRDTPQGAEIVPRAAFDAVEPDAAPDVLGEPPSLTASVHLLYEDYPGDLERFLAGLPEDEETEIVVVDNASGDGDQIERIAAARPDTRVLHLARGVGWAEARNAGLRGARGRVVVLADLSVEPHGDIVGPLVAALADPATGVAGPLGLVTTDLRTFEETPGPEADAIEGYLLAARRDDLAAAGLVDPGYRWYRNADIDLSFRIRALGRRAVVVPVPMSKHTHRGWEAVADDEERARRSRKAFNRFLATFDGRWDLVLARRGEHQDPA